MDSSAWNRLSLEADLRRAIQNDQLRVFYQPIVALETEQIVELEALVRWQHPERGLFRRAISFRSPKRPGSSFRSAFGSWSRRAGNARIGTTFTRATPR